MEGYFRSENGWESCVRVSGQDCDLVLARAGAAGMPSEQTPIPHGHLNALLQACVGRVEYEQLRFPVDRGLEAVIDCYAVPHGVDVASVRFNDAAAASRFSPPSWFGAEVSGEGAFRRFALAMNGPPDIPEVPLSNAALNAILNIIEDRYASEPASGTVHAIAAQ